MPWWFPSASQQIIDWTLDSFNKHSKTHLQKGFFDQTRRWDDILEKVRNANDIIEWGRGQLPNIGDLGPQVKPRNPPAPVPGPPPPPGHHPDVPIDLDQQPRLRGGRTRTRQKKRRKHKNMEELLAATNPNHSFWLTKKGTRFIKPKFKSRMKKKQLYYESSLIRSRKRPSERDQVNSRKRLKNNRGRPRRPPLAI
jgi:hypothetical protein